MSEVCYQSYAGKRRDFVKLTVPAIRRAALDAARNDEPLLTEWMSRTRVLDARDAEAMLEALHNAARAGRYREHMPENCDAPRGAGDVLASGGDCDQWAVVLLACLCLLRIPAALVSFGDETDPFEHVAVAAYIEDQPYLLDPKGSQAGSDFNEWPVYQQVTGGWRL